MLNNYLKIALRNFKREKFYSFINILGLASGLVTSIFILLWIIDEVGYDKYNIHKDRIFQIMGNHRYPEGTFTMGDTNGPLAQALRDLPEVEEAARLNFFGGRMLFQNEDQLFYEKGGYAERELFNIFTIVITRGNPDNPIPNNSSIAISEKIAKKYFNDRSALGSTLKLNHNLDVMVSAVFKDLPQNSTLQFDFLLPYEIYAKAQEYDQEWGAWTAGRTFVKVHEGINTDTLTSKISRLITRPKIWPRWDSNVELLLFSLNDWRLRSNFADGKQSGGRIVYVMTFLVVAIFIVLIACINFMNLATARAMKRSKEVGLRKAIGASRSSLIKQFMGESALYTIIALIVALLCVHLFLPSFNTLISKNLSVDYSNPVLLLSITSVTLITILLAGSYPAFFLSSLDPNAALKSDQKSALSGSRLRKALVVAQFSFSVLLIISALVVYGQINFIRNKNLGFDKEHIVYFDRKDALKKNFESFRNEAIQNPLIKNLGLANANPMEIFGQIDGGEDAWPGKKKNEGVIFKYLKCDESFLSTLNFTVVDGRSFSRQFSMDTTNYIINEEAVKRMKLENPVGQIVKFERPGQIVGVIKDFHSSGLQKPIEPVLIAMRPDEAQTVFIKFDPGTLEESVAFIEKLYRKYEPDFPLELKFIDEPFSRQYQTEILIGKLAMIFMVMAIVISLLGLFALASFMTEKRSKEIAVRKVMGASVYQLVFMLCKEFVLLSAIAIVLGAPAAYYLMSSFLKRFAFRIDIDPLIFIFTSVATVALTIAVVSFHALKVSRTNPVKIIRVE